MKKKVKDVECAACGFKGPFDKWKSLQVVSDTASVEYFNDANDYFLLYACPNCGTVRFEE